jgi:prevent-host-death family protein
MGSWGLAQAKAQLSEIVHLAESDGPQTITRSGRDVAVVVSLEEWNKCRKPEEPEVGLGTWLMNSPLRGSGLEFPRASGKARAVEF